MRRKTPQIRNATHTTQRHGQAALEYLVTYGWAFVVIIVAVGTLAYFGFLNPTRYMPTRCSFGTQLECIDYQLQLGPEDGTKLGPKGFISLQLRNNFGADIIITEIQTITASCKWSTLGLTPVTIPKGKSTTTTDLILICPNNDENLGVSLGDRKTMPLIITFRRDANSPQHNVTGEIFATVSEAPEEIVKLGEGGGSAPPDGLEAG